MIENYFPAASKNFPFFFLGGKCSLAQHSGERWERLRVGAFNGCFPLIIPVLHGFFLPGRSLRVFPAMQADVSIPLEIIIPRLQAWLFSLAILALLRQAIHVTIIYCHDASDFSQEPFLVSGLHGDQILGARSNQQDSFSILAGEDALVLVLADGMGGYTGGELASRAAVEGCSRAFERKSGLPGERMKLQ